MRETHMLRWSLVLVLVGMVAIGACKKSVEGESKAWTSNTAQVKELLTLYPAFAPAINEQLQTAQAVFDQAKGLAEEQAAEKLAAANSALTKGFVGKLGGLDQRVKGLRGKLVDAATASGDEGDRLGVKVAAEDATKTLAQIEAALKVGAKDVASADVVLKKLDSDLETAEKNIDKVIKAAKSKKDEKASASADKKADEVKKEAEKAPWTCEYCGSSNAADLTKCSSCGAALGAGK